MSSFKDVHLRSLVQGGTSTPNMTVSSSLTGVSNTMVTTQSVKTPVVEGSGHGITVGNAAEETRIVGSTVTVPVLTASSSVVTDTISTKEMAGTLDVANDANYINLGGLNTYINIKGTLNLKSIQSTQTVTSSQGVEAKTSSDEINIGGEQITGVLNLGANKTRTGDIVIGSDRSTTVLNGQLSVGESTGEENQVLAIYDSKPLWTTLNLGVTADYVNAQIQAAVSSLLTSANTWSGLNTFQTGLAYVGNLIANGTGDNGGTLNHGEVLGVEIDPLNGDRTIQKWHFLETGSGTGTASSLTSAYEYSDITIGANQTTGAIHIGSASTRSGDINIGAAATTTKLYGNFTVNDDAGSAGQVLTIVDGKPTWAPLSASQPASQPVGSISTYAGTICPDGWLFCDGSAYNISDYYDLYQIIGTRYGGTGQLFKVPDLRNRFLRGTSAVGTLDGTSKGSDTVNISVTQLPSHDHSVSAHNHSVTAHTHTINEHTHVVPKHGHTTANHTHDYYDAYWSAQGSTRNEGVPGTNGGTDTDNNLYYRYATTGGAIVTVNDKDAFQTTGTLLTTNQGGGGTTGNGGNGSTGTTGGGEALTIIPSCLEINYIIKYFLHR
jgi:microcystin-dependent protein